MSIPSCRNYWLNKVLFLQGSKWAGLLTRDFFLFWSVVCGFCLTLRSTGTYVFSSIYSRQLQLKKFLTYFLNKKFQYIYPLTSIWTTRRRESLVLCIHSVLSRLRHSQHYGMHDHRVYRAPGFLSSRPNAPPPPRVQGRRHTRLRGGGGTQCRRWDRHSGTLKYTKPVFLNLLRSSRIDSQPGGIDSWGP